MRQLPETVEHPFGTIMHWIGSINFLMKRLKNLRIAMALSVLADNLTRVMNILGIQPVNAAIRAQVEPCAAPKRWTIRSTHAYERKTPLEPATLESTKIRRSNQMTSRSALTTNSPQQRQEFPYRQHRE